MKIVTIYTTPTCGYCKMEKQYLTDKNVPFTAVDVSSDPQVREEFMNKGKGHSEFTGGVPLTVIVAQDGSEELVFGFDQAKLDSALEIGASS